MNSIRATTFLCIAALACFANADEPPGFVSLFDGKSLDGFQYDERFWRVEDNAIIGETTSSNAAERNTFLILGDEKYSDFELRFSYQVDGFNSGVQYRSVEKPGFVVDGYQADFEAQWHGDGKTDKFSGMFFEENGRMFLGKRGQAVIVRAGDDGPRIDVIGTVGDAVELEKNIRRDDWNEYTIVARGYQFTHIINGRVMSVAYDEDAENRRAEGIFAFQLHSGPPMKIQIKHLKVRRLR
ncbi:MAG: DUF1080 domain-containing protein [Planctomycetota bacterium]